MGSTFFFGSLAMSKMVKTVGKATPTSRRAGTTVQPNSSLVLPWTWTGSGRPGRCRCRTTVAMRSPCTRTNTTAAIAITKRKRLFCLLAIGPSGSSVSCGALAAQLARNTKMAGNAANLRRRTRPPSPCRIRTSIRVAAALYRGPSPKLETPTLGGLRPPRTPRNPRLSQTQPVQGIRTALPVLVHFHVRFQVNLDPEDRLELHPGRRSGVPDDGTALPDDDALLRVPLYPDHRPQHQQIGAFLDLFDGHGQRVGQLLAGHGQELLPEELGGQEGVRLVGDHPVRVVQRPFGQPARDLADQGVGPVSCPGRQRNVGGEVTERAGGAGQVTEDPLPRGGIDLVDDEDDRGFDLGEQPGDVPVPRSDGGGSVDEEADDVDGGQGVGGALVQPPAELRLRLVDSRRVDEDDLAPRPVPHSVDLVARRLGPVGDNRDLGADQLVQQGRLPHVGASDQRGDAGSESGLGRGHGAAGPPGSASLGVIRTVRIRRPCTLSARNSRPWNSTVSPSTGTWPSRLNMRPPTVSQSVSGNSTSSSSLTSSIGVPPATRTPPSGSRSI